MIILSAVMMICISILFIIVYNCKKNIKIETATIPSNQNVTLSVTSMPNWDMIKDLQGGTQCRLDELIDGNYYFVITDWNSGALMLLKYLGIAHDKITIGYSQNPIVERRHCFLESPNKILRIPEKNFIPSLRDLTKTIDRGDWAAYHPMNQNMGVVKVTENSITSLCISKERIDNER